MRDITSKDQNSWSTKRDSISSSKLAKLLWKNRGQMSRLTTIEIVKIRREVGGRNGVGRGKKEEEESPLVDSLSRARDKSNDIETSNPETLTR